MRALTLTALFCLLLIVVACNVAAAMTAPWWTLPVWIVGSWVFAQAWCEMMECAIRWRMSASK
jgi:hypothetical protein